MRRTVLHVALVICLLMSPVVLADLAGDVKTVLRDKFLAKTEVGVVIVQLGDTPAGEKVLFKHNSEIPLVPASNLKLITTSAALDKLGGDFRFRTILARHGDDLILIGDGDPTLGDVEMLKKGGWDVTTVFRNWAEMLKKKNLTTVHDVLVDDSVFDQEFLHAKWPPRQENHRYEAQVGGVNLNANCVDFYLKVNASGAKVDYITDPQTEFVKIENTCVSGGSDAVALTRKAGGNELLLSGTCPVSNGVPVSVTINDPPMFAATVLAETLAANGIKVEGKVGRDRDVRSRLLKKETADGYVPLAILETQLPQVLQRANKDSMNLYAECLCKRVGFAASGQSGSWANGTAAVGAFLQKVGVADTEFHLEDGCGLSKDDTISPNAIVRVLAYNYYGKQKDVFMQSLSVAGQDGTLADRFRGSDLRGRVFGKSGFVEHVSALSGYLKAKDDKWYAFSILINGIPPKSNTEAKALQEQIVKAIDAQARSGR